MKKATFVFIMLVILLASLLLASKALADNSALVCHKPGTPAEHWLNVAPQAVPAHQAHGDGVWPQVTECNGEVIPAPAQTATPTPLVTEEPVATIDPTEEPATLSPQLLYLPMLINTCGEYWPWCHSPGSPQNK